MRRTNYNRLWYFLLIPVVGIALAIIFSPARTGEEGVSMITYALHAVSMTSGLWIGCMLIVSFLWNNFPWEQTPVKHLLLEIGLILVYTNAFSYGLYRLEIHFGIAAENPDELFFSAVATNLITLQITAIHEAIEFYQQWKFNFSKSIRLEKDNIEAKYEMLKTQVNPHFLFNSLNSLTTLVEDNEKAVDYISNLSEFLRYMLRSRERQLALVREEIGILRQYLELQKSRFRDNLQFTIDVDERFYHYATPPLVLQMLVENCIKHNILSKEKPLHIKVYAEKQFLSVENNLQPKNEVESTGQGLRNISERYRFFTTEQVKINQTNGTFRVTIPLLQAEL